MRAYYLVNNFLPEDERIPLDPRASGRVYIFTYDQDRWSQQDILRPEKETPGSNFGSSISLSADGDSLAIGAPYTHINLPAQAGLNTPESGTYFCRSSLCIFPHRRPVAPESISAVTDSSTGRPIWQQCFHKP